MTCTSPIRTAPCICPSCKEIANVWQEGADYVVSCASCGYRLEMPVGQRPGELTPVSVYVIGMDTEEGDHVTELVMGRDAAHAELQAQKNWPERKLCYSYYNQSIIDPLEEVVFKKAAA